MACRTHLDILEGMVGNTQDDERPNNKTNSYRVRLLHSRREELAKIRVGTIIVGLETSSTPIRAVSSLP